jgi:hypothetical protein
MRKTSKMPNTPAPRIVFESSELHRMAPKTVHFGSWSEINNPGLGPTELYGRTKLAMILGAKYGLYERVIKPNNDNIYALSVHPGTVSLTSLVNDLWEMPRLTANRLTQICKSNGRALTLA